MLSSLATGVAATVPCVAAVGGPWFGWWWFLIPLFWIGLVVLIVSLAGRRWRRVAAARGGYPGYAWGGPHGATRSAEQTLAQRYANGDIDEKEYRARLEVLRANRGDGA